MSDERTGPHSAGSAPGNVRDTLTISEAAAFLGVHKNTVRNRIKDGTYEAEKVATERGPTYLIKRESILDTLTTNTLSSAPHEHGTAIVSPQSLAFAQELLRPFVNEVGQVREELGAERAHRRMAEERVAQLEEEIAALKAAPEPADLKAPESPETAPEASSAPDDAGGEAQEAAERPETVTRREPIPFTLTTRLGMSPRALAIGAIATLLAWFYVFAVRLFGAHTLPGSNFYVVHLPNYVAMAPLAVVPLLFGLWAGSTKRPSLRWFSSPHRWLRRGGRSALEISIFAAGLPAWVGWAISSIYYLTGSEITPGVLSIGFVYAVGALIWGAAGSLAFMSGAFLGNALGRVGIIGTPKVPPEGGEESGSEGVWTPRQEGRWGIIGGIITASIPAIATVIAALLEGK